jgi:hypothetical protein
MLCSRGQAVVMKTYNLVVPEADSTFECDPSLHVTGKRRGTIAHPYALGSTLQSLLTLYDTCHHSFLKSALVL